MNIQTAGVAELREEEKRCMAKFEARARKLMAADPRLNIDVARGRAIEAMPHTTANYLAARSRLTMMGVRPHMFGEA